MRLMKWILALLLLLATLNGVDTVDFVNTADEARFAAFSIVGTIKGNVKPSIGIVQKHKQNPLLVQDQPWEQRLDK